MKAQADLIFMKRALRLAGRGTGLTHPNPMVGAVVVRDGKIIGEGWHRGPGRPHAEVEALREAGSGAKGATMFVTLEPCDHYGQTPPCTEAILKAGISRVVVACQDPNPIVNGKGIRRLEAGGVDVATGTGRAEAQELNRAFFHFICRREPYVTLKVASTLDGRIADASGRSRWITGDQARREVHRLRSQADAVLVGSGTVLSDDPMLTVRGLGKSPNPLRVVLDPEIRTPVEARIVHSASEGKTVLVTAPGTDERKRAVLEDKGVRLLTLPLREGRFSWDDLGPALLELGVLHLLVEGGSATSTWFLAQSVVRRIEFFLAMKFLGADGLASIGALGGRSLDESPEFRLLRCRTVGKDVRITADAL